VASAKNQGIAIRSYRHRACIYVCTNTDKGLKVSLLKAKSKVAPLKTKTLPCLELCAAHLLADLYNRVRPLFNSKRTEFCVRENSGSDPISRVL